MRSIYSLNGHQRMIQGRHGLFVYNHHDKYIGKALELYGEYCEHEVELFKQLLSPSRHVIEVGANIGAHTVPLAKAVPYGVIHAFEPQPIVFQNLCANLSINCLANTLAWPFAVGAEIGSLVVPSVDYGCQGNFGGVSLLDEGDGLRIQVVTLDTYAINFDVALIKADVEGMEEQVLRGAENVIEKCRPVLYLENDRVEKSKSLIEKCWALKYRLFWHTPPLYNEQNWCNNCENIYTNIHAFNMIGIPEEMEFKVAGFSEIIDSNNHPLRSSV